MSEFYVLRVLRMGYDDFTLFRDSNAALTLEQYRFGELGGSVGFPSVGWVSRKVRL